MKKPPWGGWCVVLGLWARLCSCQIVESLDMIPLSLKLKERSAMNVFRSVVHGTPIFSKNSEGALVCNMDVENSIELYLRIIQCGDSVEILSPESFKKKFCKMLTKILALYQ